MAIGDQLSEFQVDLKTLSKMALRKKYASEACTHGNMKLRCKTKGTQIHSEFEDFRNFLGYVGPKPNKNATLDRILNSDPEYAPGKVRWADKQTQNNNKSDNLIFHCTKSGRYFNAKQLAKKQSITPTAIRKRRKEGWADFEIIDGYRQPNKHFIHQKQNSHHSSVIKRHESHEERLFRQRQEKCEEHRNEYNEEYFINTPREIVEILGEDAWKFIDSEWMATAERVFLKKMLPIWWKDYKPHIRFQSLHDFQKEWILKIDPNIGINQENDFESQL